MIINWNLDPEIIRIGGFSLRYYSILFAGGIYFAYLIVKHIYSKNSLEIKKLESISIHVFVGLIIGARLGHCLFYDFAYYSKHIAEIFLPFAVTDSGINFTGYQGLSSHGGGIGIILSLLIWKLRSAENKLFPALDAIAIAAPLTAGCIRLGNFMNSEIIGEPTSGTWGVIFSRVDYIPRHPGQLYESVFYFCLFVIMIFLYRKTRLFSEKGQLFGIFLAAVFVFRIIIETVKENQSSFESSMPVNMGQILSIPFIIAGLFLIFKDKIKWFESNEKD
ncbi:MAG TPA: prolipoprotein diacylglyceryl transferase [Spirochaetota bacterium]|nr:prolipoprotein diacylglyceryl transferase [Spirochaetota bacterium]HPM33860.1 prolipoprotein diacylglyceryl transferase [Spirochaetota bacterium]HPW51223.1 prolipoprotein diacylglyceryl transferase [Spirochaetota bacterium]